MNYKNASAIKRNKTIMIYCFEVFLLLCSIVLFVFPFLNLIAVSLSSSDSILSGKVFLLPVGFTTAAWKYVFANKELISSFFFTVFLTALYTVISLFLTMIASYPLSKKDLKGRTPLLGFFLFTMYFSGGLIPTYFLYQSLNLLDNFWVLVLPGAFSVYNFLILKSFFQEIPSSLEEAAKIDGANDFQILFKIFLPMSLPVLATLALFFAVSRWNSFSDALYFIPTHKEYTPLQLILQRTLQDTTDSMDEEKIRGAVHVIRVIKEAQKAAIIIFTVTPIIMVYPWLQKYFVKGVMIGAVKG